MLLRPAEDPPELAIVLYAAGVPAGFPSPADDHIEGRLDLNRHLVRRPAATFFARADGDSMTDAGIFDGDLLVVDRGIDPEAGDVVVATIDGGLAVKRLARRGNGWELAPANPAFAPIPVDPEEGVTIWGVVTHSIRTHCERP